MDKSIGNAFTYMFKDADWKYKLFILAALAFPGAFMSYQSDSMKASMATMQGAPDRYLSYFLFLLLMLVFVVICTFIFEGYCCKCTNKIIYSDNEVSPGDLLPAWENEFWQYSKIGIAFSIGVGLLGLAVLLGSILIVPILFYMVGYVALKTLFCVDFKIMTFFAWKKAWKLMSSNPSQYFSVIFLSLAVYLVFGIVAFFCSKSYILSFVTAFAQAYVFLVLAYLRGTLFPVPPEVFFEAE